MRPGEPPAPVTLPLLCALGHHKTDGLARWNAGYYFARCTRCRRDLVRTAFTRWQIPRGFRVVWQGEPNGIPASLAQVGSHPGSSAPVEFPIRDDARFMRPILATGDYAGSEVDARADEPAFAFGDPAAVPGGEQRDPERTEHAIGGAPFEDEASRENVADTDPHEESGVLEASGTQPVPSWFDGENRFEEGTRFGPDDRLVEYEAVPEADAEKLEAEEDDAERGDEEATAALFQANDLVDEAKVPTPNAPPSVSNKYPVVPDFMDESANGVGWDVVSGRIVPSAGSVPPASSPEPGRDVVSGVLSQGWQDLVRKRAQVAGEQGREWLRGLRANRPQASEPPQAVAEQRPPVPAPVPVPAVVPTPAVPAPQPAASGKPRITASDTPPPADAPALASPLAPTVRTDRVNSFLMHGGPVAAAVIFGGLVLAAALVDGRNGPTRVVYRPVPVASVPTAVAPPTAKPQVPAWKVAAGRTAYVTADLLKCRATPGNDADTIRRLSRGASVQVLGTSTGWVSVVHRGEQCWVSAQHVSMKRPA